MLELEFSAYAIVLSRKANDGVKSDFPESQYRLLVFQKYYLFFEIICTTFNFIPARFVARGHASDNGDEITVVIDQTIIFGFRSGLTC